MMNSLITYKSIAVLDGEGAGILAGIGGML